MCSGAVAAALLSSWGGLALSTTVLAAPVLISEWNDERLGGALTVLHGTAAAGALLAAAPHAFRAKRDAHSSTTISYNSLSYTASVVSRPGAAYWSQGASSHSLVDVQVWPAGCGICQGQRELGHATTVEAPALCRVTRMVNQHASIST